MESTISKFLIDNHGFLPVYHTRTEDLQALWDSYDCVLRLSEIHYLFYSDKHKHFTIKQKFEQSKGKAGGGRDDGKSIMLPKVINNHEDAERLICGISDITFSLVAL